MRRILLLTATLLSVSLVGSPRANAWSYSYANETFPDRILHQIGYTGAGGNILISVGIDPTSVNAAEMVAPTKNVINTWNQLVPTTGNVFPGALGPKQADFESILMHEMGHVLGLGHPNVGGLDLVDSNYTRSGTGGDGYDFNPLLDVDGIVGSGDDIRGNDPNLNWFRKSNNNPFSLGSIVDSTYYSRDLAFLPGADSYSANPDRTVALGIYGLSNTESIMQQMAFWGEVQRTLGHDDVAGIRYSMSGLDEVAGNADDYTFELTYAGLTASADIVLDFDTDQTDFATTTYGVNFLGGDHWSISDAHIYFEPTLSSGYAWVIPEPSTLAMLAGGVIGFLILARRKRRQG